MKSTKKKLLVVAVLGAMVCASMVAGCAPSTASPSSMSDAGSDAPEVSQAGAWSSDLDCATCHSTEATSAESATCTAGFHMASQNFECVTCHADEAALNEAHGDMTGKAPKKLKKTSVDASLCETCHDSAALAEATSACTVLTDESGTTINPHDVPVNADHENRTCLDCHGGHNEEGVETTARDYCMGCHHENVYECHTCHE